MPRTQRDSLVGGGEMGALIRAFDWSRTALGPLADWPQELLIAAGMVIENRFPQLLLWGPELIVCAYNDAYRPLLGDKSEALGRRCLDVWAEVEDAIADPLRAALGGESFWFERATFVLMRRGFPERAVFDFSFSPVRDGSGTVRGVLNTVVERTDRVLRESRHEFRSHFERRVRTLRDPLQILAVASEEIGRHFAAGQVAYADIDVAGQHAIIERDWNDGTIPSNVGTHRLEDFGAAFIDDLKHGDTVVIGDVSQDSRTAAPESLATFRRVSIGGFLNVPLVKDGVLVAVLAVHCRKVRPWLPEDVALAEEAAERTWAAVERARAEVALREADGRKDEFLATLAHELRNPLAPIQSSIDVLRLRPDIDAATTRRVLEIMQRQMRQLKRLVDDLLDVSRITRGKVSLEKQPIDLGRLVRGVVETMIDPATRCVSLELPPQPLMVDGDPVRLRQVVGNLVDNAVKFTAAEGHVRVSVARDGHEARIVVADDGVGMDAALIPRVFAMFEQGSASQGLGIGLTLVQRLVLLHGGSVEARSPGLGCGSEFVVRLPLLPEHDG